MMWQSSGAYAFSPASSVALTEACKLALGGSTCCAIRGPSQPLTCLTCFPLLMHTSHHAHLPPRMPLAPHRLLTCGSWHWLTFRAAGTLHWRAVQSSGAPFLEVRSPTNPDPNPNTLGPGRGAAHRDQWAPRTLLIPRRHSSESRGPPPGMNAAAPLPSHLCALLRPRHPLHCQQPVDFLLLRDCRPWHVHPGQVSCTVLGGRAASILRPEPQ